MEVLNWKNILLEWVSETIESIVWDPKTVSLLFSLFSLLLSFRTGESPQISGAFVLQSKYGRNRSVLQRIPNECNVERYCVKEIGFLYDKYTNNGNSNVTQLTRNDGFSGYFPEFLAEWTNEGKMSPDDYVYGFSLLMYFACVKHPDKKIHKICGEMHEESQQAVQAFLQNLLDCNSFTRETIRCVIESSGELHSIPVYRFIYSSVAYTI